jgi:hypothetical protein
LATFSFTAKDSARAICPVRHYSARTAIATLLDLEESAAGLRGFCSDLIVKVP